MTPSGTSPYVLAFAELMEAKLRENAHKGGREGWRSISMLGLLEYLEEEIRELRQAIDEETDEAVVNECADVANFAMMIADVAGGLKPQFQPKDAGWTLDPDEVDP